MKTKYHVEKYEATTAIILRLTQAYHGSGRRVAVDCWFGSVKSVFELQKCGLFSIMLVKTAHKHFPCTVLGEADLTMGE